MKPIMLTFDFSFVLGNIAAFFTTVSFLPQAIKTIQSKNTKALSLPMYVLFVLGVALWILYGIDQKQWPVILGNAVTLIFAGTVLFCMIRDRL